MFISGSVVLDAFRAPIEISLGIVYGVLCGLLMWILPTKHHVSVYVCIYMLKVHQVNGNHANTFIFINHTHYNQRYVTKLSN